MRPARFFLFIFLILCVASEVASATEADAKKQEDDENFRYVTITTKEGLTFRVPEDMPVENRGGIQAPIPFDEYMYGKFKQIDLRLKNIEAMLQGIHEAVQKSPKESDSKASDSKDAAAKTSVTRAAADVSGLGVVK